MPSRQPWKWPLKVIFGFLWGVLYVVHRGPGTQLQRSVFVFFIIIACNVLCCIVLVSCLLPVLYTMNPTIKQR
ncbi:hypothetical protein B9Z19DRAFT_1089326 [Tuber borchii]|uniref:Uncharacterized protein n=1 Tax=Tuber borchii TaxID=42251 RepID=A0A2T6ZKA5_TUBBO|nr:hypothetical protein B9Z19DRAFT_1089326 [Tuber borchii]